MVQQTFTDMEYANRKRITRREAFLDAMDSIIPWKEWMKLIVPFYIQKERGRKLIPLETMLRMYLMQNWFAKMTIRSMEIPAISVWKNARKYGRTPTFQVWTTALPKDSRRTA